MAAERRLHLLPTETPVERGERVTMRALGKNHWRLALAQG